jgi:hypothetical protein
MFHLLLAQVPEGQPNPEAVAAIAAIFGFICFAVYGVLIIAMIAGLWKTFTKAGQPGWASIIPFYNIVVLADICGKPWWWLFLCLIPIVNIVVLIILYLKLAEVFGKGGGFAVGLILLPFIFLPILGFGSARYLGRPAE